MRAWRRWLGWCGAVAVGAGVGLVVPAGATVPCSAATTQPVPAMDEAMRLLAAARRAYAGLNDYTCAVIKQERINGQLQPEHVIAMKARTAPFSVYFRWHEPANLAGQ